jgi:hypothetical protein
MRLISASRAFVIFQLLFVVCFRGGVGFAADPEPPKEPLQQEKVFLQLLANTENIAESEFGKYEANPVKIKALSGFIISLQSSAQGRQIPQPYRLQLTVDAWELGIVAKAVFGRPAAEMTRWTEWLDNAGWDLSAKAEYAQQNFTDPFSNINITVTTKTGPKEVSGCQIWYSLKGLYRYKDRHLSFDKLSSPSTGSIPPGSYVFWTVKGGKTGRLDQVNDLGADGQPTLSIDLEAP